MYFYNIGEYHFTATNKNLSMALQNRGHEKRHSRQINCIIKDYKLITICLLFVNCVNMLSNNFTQVFIRGAEIKLRKETFNTEGNKNHSDILFSKVTALN